MKFIVCTTRETDGRWDGLSCFKLFKEKFSSEIGKQTKFNKFTSFQLKMQSKKLISEHSKRKHQSKYLRWDKMELTLRVVVGCNLLCRISQV